MTASDSRSPGPPNPAQSLHEFPFAGSRSWEAGDTDTLVLREEDGVAHSWPRRGPLGQAATHAPWTPGGTASLLPFADEETEPGRLPCVTGTASEGQRLATPPPSDGRRPPPSPAAPWRGASERPGDTVAVSSLCNRTPTPGQLGPELRSATFCWDKRPWPAVHPSSLQSEEQRAPLCHRAVKGEARPEPVWDLGRVGPAVSVSCQASSGDSWCHGSCPLSVCPSLCCWRLQGRGTARWPLVG